MSDVNEEMACKCQKNTEPKAVKHIAGKIICQKTDSEEGDEFFVDAQGKSFMGQSSIGLRHLWKTVEKIRISLEEPGKSDDLFHVVEDEKDGQKQNVILHKCLR